MSGTSSGDVGITFNANTGQFEAGAGKVRQQIEGIKRSAQGAGGAIMKGGNFLGIAPNVMGKSAEGLSRVVAQFTGLQGIALGMGPVAAGITAAIAATIMFKQHLSETDKAARALVSSMQKLAMTTGAKARGVTGVNQEKAAQIVKASGGRLSMEDIGTHGEGLGLDKMAVEQATGALIGIKNLAATGKGKEAFAGNAVRAGLSPGDLSAYNELSGNRNEDLAKLAAKLGRNKGMSFFDKQGAMAFAANQIGQGQRPNLGRITADDIASGRKMLSDTQGRLRVNDTIGNALVADDQKKTDKNNEAFSQLDRASQIRAKLDAAFPMAGNDLSNSDLMNLNGMDLENKVRQAAFARYKSQFQDGKTTSGWMMSPGGAVPTKSYDIESSTGGKIIKEIVRSTSEIIRTKDNYTQDAGDE